MENGIDRQTLRHCRNAARRRGILPAFLLAASLLLTRAQHDSNLPAIQLEPVFAGLTLDRPIRMEQPNDDSGRFFVVEQQGRILIVPKGDDGGSAVEFFNIVDRKPYVDNEEGLLGLAFHPRFRENGLFYVYYTQHDPRRSVISEFKVSAADRNRADLKSERVLMEIPQPFGNHNGGQVSFGPDGFLYITLGDGGAADDPHNNAQNSASLLGKILRIDVNSRTTVGEGKNERKLAYGIPNDNPFANQPYGVRGEIWAWGLRNVWRFSWDRKTGDLWAGDVGQNLWEEVDLIVKGGNYGWNVREAFHDFKPGPEGARYIDPILEYPHNPNLSSQSRFSKHSPGLSITGGYVYRGSRFPELQGVYVYADYALGTIWGLRYENGQVTHSATLLQQPKNVSSFAEDLTGELYVITLDGKIFRVTASSGAAP